MTISRLFEAIQMIMILKICKFQDLFVFYLHKLVCQDSRVSRRECEYMVAKPLTSIRGRDVHILRRTVGVQTNQRSTHRVYLRSPPLLHFCLYKSCTCKINRLYGLLKLLYWARRENKT